MPSHGIQARPWPLPKRLDLNRQPEELFGRTSKELHQQQMVERVACSLPVIDQTTEPVVTQFQTTFEPFQQCGRIMIEKPRCKARVLHLARVSCHFLLKQQA
jgi:hypothetical protein